MGVSPRSILYRGILLPQVSTLKVPLIVGEGHGISDESQPGGRREPRLQRKSFSHPSERDSTISWMVAKLLVEQVPRSEVDGVVSQNSDLGVESRGRELLSPECGVIKNPGKHRPCSSEAVAIRKGT